MKLLVTGGAGFIGSNFIHYILDRHKDWAIINLDQLTYAGDLKNLSGIDEARCRFVRGNIAEPAVVDGVIRSGVDVIINFAAESHVDRSIKDATPFLDSNVKGVQVLLEAARRSGVPKLIQVSTDEVYGSLGPSGFFTEDSPLAPNSPYSASKAAADLLVRAYHRTYGLPVVITRCSNNFGPRQYPEKLVPVIIKHALAGRPVPIYGDGLNVRDWIYVLDHCRALETVVLGGRPGEVYNIGGGAELTNLELTGKILDLLNRPRSLIRFVEDRPGHDRRYAINYEKIKRALGWKPGYEFNAALKDTVHWYMNNRSRWPDWEY